MPGTPSPDPVSTLQRRIAETATRTSQPPLATILRHIDIDWPTDASPKTREDRAVGLEGRTAAGYAADLECNLRWLRDRAKSGRTRRRSCGGLISADHDAGDAANSR